MIMDPAGELGKGLEYRRVGMSAYFDSRGFSRLLDHRTIVRRDDVDIQRALAQLAAIPGLVGTSSDFRSGGLYSKTPFPVDFEEFCR
ncbi:hypothetical protein [Actinopolyspora xinjiangensis]|uniref:hypothetical protein n=1 Tax=Actinopolyspora xinjiangensis TaxID=405564 RepID=UPI001480B51A|nr:hypothetical protein [Actinopolyspora xinjiangensis]